MPEKYVKNSGGYLLAKDLALIKEAAKFMKLSWKMIAARPEWSESLLYHLEHEETMEAACEKWSSEGW